MYSSIKNKKKKKNEKKKHHIAQQFVRDECDWDWYHDDCARIEPKLAQQTTEEEEKNPKKQKQYLLNHCTTTKNRQTEETKSVCMRGSGHSRTPCSSSDRLAHCATMAWQEEI